MTQKTIKITGCVLTIALGLLFSLSAFMKLSDSTAALAQASLFGIDANTYRIIGFVELVSLVLFMVPRTGVLGALLLVAYMGGAIVTHLQHQQPIAIAVIVQGLIWVAIALRFPELMQRLFPTWRKSTH